MAYDTLDVNVLVIGRAPELQEDEVARPVGCLSEAATKYWNIIGDYGLTQVDRI